MAAPRSYWLVKSEPDCFSIQDLAECPGQTTCWSGVRNYQARNYMRAMQPGDCVLFYHSSVDPPAVAGTCLVARSAYPDTTALDAKDDHYDPKATRANPIWDMVDIRLVQVFAEPVSLGELRAVKELSGMELLRKGSRLSVMPVRQREFEIVVAMAKGPRPHARSAARRPTARKPSSKPRKKSARA